MSKRRCTAEETLLTFWPPAPCARTALISTSPSGIEIAVNGLSKPDLQTDVAAFVYRGRTAVALEPHLDFAVADVDYDGGLDDQKFEAHAHIVEALRIEPGEHVGCVEQ